MPQAGTGGQTRRTVGKGEMSTAPTSQAPPTERGRPFPLIGEGWPYLLVPLIPVASSWSSCMPMRWRCSPLRRWSDPDGGADGPGDRGVGARSGPGIGGLLNVTFGNAPELIIALFALGAGLHEVVKASLVGSIWATSCWSSGCRCWSAGGNGTGSASSRGRPPPSRSCCCWRRWRW